MRFTIDRRFLKNFDWLTLSLIVVISLMGIMTIYSATRPPLDTGTHPDYYLRQMVWLGISIIALILVVSFDYTWLFRFSYPLYGIGILLLVVVLFLGKATMGAQRWLSLGPLSFQPSEFFRIIFIVVFSGYLSSFHHRLPPAAWIKGIILFTLVPMALLIKQPDLGTAIILMILSSVIVLAKGVSRRFLVILMITVLLSVPFLGHIVWEELRDYQKNRIIAFLDPEVDPSGIGYNISQSKISIGSGGTWGKGYLQGTQGPLRFLPEKHTDFIFAVYTEEWGFAGSLVLIAIYLILFLQGLDTAQKAKDAFGKLVATGITSMFFTYFTINIGMTLGLTPVVGIPLPFMSYGGTALLSNFIAAGILISIRTRRFELFY